MDFIASEPTPPGFQEVNKAFDIARELPQWRDAPVKVGVCRGDGQVIATGTFSDHRQARLFCIQMDALGYEEEAGQGEYDRVYMPRDWYAGARTAPVVGRARVPAAAFTRP
jgi:hypothetical protein